MGKDNKIMKTAHNPAGTFRTNDVVAMSMRRQFGTICPLGKQNKTSEKTKRSDGREAVQNDVQKLRKLKTNILVY